MEEQKCMKVLNRMECDECGYPASEAMWLDTEPPLQCNDIEGIKKQIRLQQKKENVQPQ